MRRSHAPLLTSIVCALACNAEVRPTDQAPRPQVAPPPAPPAPPPTPTPPAPTPHDVAIPATPTPPAPPPDLVPPPQQVEVDERRIDRTDFDFRVDIGYPALRFTPLADATRLNKQITDFVGIDARYGRDDVGFHEASCTAWVATSQLLDIECQRMVDHHTRKQIADATGGSPGDYTRTAIRVWLLPGLPAVDIHELLGSPALADACAPLLTTGAYRLDPAGLVWELRFGDEPRDEPPPGCEIEGGIPYADMKPSSPRAKAFVAAMLGPPGPADTDTE